MAGNRPGSAVDRLNVQKRRNDKARRMVVLVVIGGFE